LAEVTGSDLATEAYLRASGLVYIIVLRSTVQPSQHGMLAGPDDTVERLRGRPLTSLRE
jgi:hypothetical protein